MADLFLLISAGIPYESLVKKIGGVPPARRGSVVKLLGDSSLVPNNAGVTIIGASGTFGSAGFGSMPKNDGFSANSQKQHF